MLLTIPLGPVDGRVSADPRHKFFGAYGITIRAGVDGHERKNLAAPWSWAALEMGKPVRIHS